MFSALVLCLSCAAGEEPAPGRIFFERKIAADVLKRFEVRASRGYLERGLTSAEITKILEEARSDAENDKTILKLELGYDPDEGGRPYVECTYLARDLEREKKTKEWVDFASREFAIAKDVGACAFKGITGADVGSDGYLILEGGKDIFYLREQFTGPKKQYVEVTFTYTRDAPIDKHQFLREIIQRECRVEKETFGVVVRTKDVTAEGTWRGVAWLHGKALKVQLAAQEEIPEELVQAYAKKLPSSLPNDFAIDKTQWGREEAEYWLGRMGQVLAAGDRGEGQDCYAFCVDSLRARIFMPALEKRSIQETALEAKKAQYEQVLQLWKDRKGESYWLPGLGKLVLKGLTPEDLQREGG